MSQPVIPIPLDRRMNVLIVEDDKTTREVMNHLISARGHKVTLCSSAEDAEKALKEQGYHMAILDWMLPGKTGPEFCRWMRSQPNGDGIYVLLATGRNNSNDLEEALDAGANDYLLKPWEVEIFRSRLRIAERQVLQITERRKDRIALQDSARRVERLALVARQTQSGVVILDPEGRVEWANEAFGKMAKIPHESVEGSSFIQLIKTVDPAAVTEMEAAILKGRASEGELAVVGPDGLKLWLHYSLTPLEGDKTVSRGQVCLLSDITVVKKTDEERFKTSKIESLGILAGGIAHDLNNILTVISGNVSLARVCLQKQMGNAEEHLDKADRAALRAADLSKQLLTFAKGGDPMKQVIDLKELVEKTTRFALYGSNLTCLFALSKDLHKVEADPFQLEQVINNIVINCREALPTGGKLQVRGQNEDLPEANPYDLPKGKYVRISFADNGPGIPADVLPQIFDPYFTTKPTGSGLGLTISFSIISKHGGRIFAESIGGGAVIVVLLPMVLDDLDADSPPAAIVVNRHSVLCMDDEPTIRELTTAILSMAGYEVVAVRDGKEAVNTYRERMSKGVKFDAVILDATIPGGMGGIETIKALIKMDPEVTAIICSGYSDESALAAMESFGFKASLPKPFTSQKLVDLLSKVMGSTAMATSE